MKWVLKPEHNEAKDNKKVNLKTIRESPVYVLTKNYLVSDGESPITVTPVMMFSSEIGFTSLYYYYLFVFVLRHKA